MTYRQPARTTARRIRGRRRRAAALLVVIGAIAAAVGYELPASPSSPAPSFSPPPAASSVPVRRSEQRRPRGLDPALLGALRQAEADAAAEGVEIVVQSGRRSPEYQAKLLEEAVARYGSEEEAARWVATPETSPHVAGDAVDVGPLAATAWLSAHGAAYGLCQIYGNEPWHYELRPEAIGQGCPPMYADPTHDPRMQQ